MKCKESNLVYLRYQHWTTNDNQLMSADKVVQGWTCMQVWVDVIGVYYLRNEPKFGSPPRCRAKIWLPRTIIAPPGKHVNWIVKVPLGTAHTSSASCPEHSHSNQDDHVRSFLGVYLVSFNPALSIALKNIQLPCRLRHSFSRQLAFSIFGTLYLVGVQTSFNQSRREILNLFWLASTRAKTINAVICLP